ncbi:Homoserine kinase [Planococcus massiliensis]|uniref:Homoserine kinase n=1 Tax=Planococcus massiliensis TaxID=1499687 RepID=A0A098EIT3_9BACL|nr:homoserine kinase [Planococcus massiliensis]CEG22188.1 Homoserine kinase [Planococcus massiliensis]
MKWNDFTVTVPASTANLGPGFDSIGLALDLHMTIHVSENPVWIVEYADEEYRHLPSSSDNLIVQTAKKVAQKYGQQLPSAKLLIETDIPLGRGLGSSASAIAGGIELADCLLGLKIPMQEKVRIGTEMEGHPDNISASLLGGATISYANGEELAVVHVPKVDIGIIILVPQEVFLTSESRGLLPEKLDYKEAVSSSAAANVVSAAIARGDWQTAGRMMEKDEFHEPYRKAKFPGFDEIRSVCRKAGAYGVAISGAGPSLFVMTEKGKEHRLSEILSKQFTHYECLLTKPSESGIKSVQTVL